MIISNLTEVRSDFLKLVNAPDGDIKFLVGEEEVVKYGHSLILRARCLYFDAMLSGNWKETTEGVFRKPNIKPEIFDLILHYIYGGHTEPSSDQIVDLLHAAAELSLTGLMTASEAVISAALTVDNVCDILMAAALHRMDNLAAQCRTFIAGHASSISSGSHILTLDDEQLRYILSMDEFMLNELDVWRLVVRWACHKLQLNHFSSFADLASAPVRMVVSTVNADEGSDISSENSHVSVATSDAAEIKRLNQDLTQSQLGTVITLTNQQFEDLKATIEPVLSSVRFHTLPIVDFHRFVEGTRLLPPELCLRVYQHHTLPITLPGITGLAPPRFDRTYLVEPDMWWTLVKILPRSSGSIPNLKMIYRATRDGFTSCKFHELCRDRGATLTLAKTSKGPIIGGMNSVPWSGYDCSYLSSTTNFIFIITDSIHTAKVINMTRAAYLSPLCGPAFGESDLYITSDGKDSRASRSDYHPIGIKETLGDSFDVVDYEVFQIIES